MTTRTVDNGALSDLTVDVRTRSGADIAVVAMSGREIDFAPGYHGADSASTVDVGVDSDGYLGVRGPVTTDEGTVRVNFANSSLAVSIGTATFTNASATVTGTGFLGALFAANVGDYVKLDADAESAWAQIESIDSDTSLTLVAAYTGTGGTGASSRAIVKPATGTGGSIAVASGAATVTCGTTASAVHTLGRLVDYAPLVVQAGVTVSQRIANQDIYVGAWHENATPRWYAWFRINGTTNTTVICESGRNPTGAPSASEIESTTVTLPNASTTAAARRYRVELLVDRVRFYVDAVLVAEHHRGVPAPHDEMFTGVRCVNGTTPGSSTTITVDYLTAINVNKLAIAVLSDAENIVASQPPAMPFSYSQAGVISINTVLLQIDASQCRSFLIQCSSMGTTGVVTPEWSNDGTNWVAATIMTPAGATATTFNAAGMWSTHALGRFFRLRLSTATTAGTTTLSVFCFQTPVGPVSTQPVSGTVTATVASISTSVTPGTAAANLGKAEDAVAASGDTGVFMLAVQRASPSNQASAAGDYHELQVNTTGSLWTQNTFGTTGGATAAQVISAATTNATSVKASAGTLTSLAATNNSASWRYLKFHNTASAPTAGSGVVLTYGLPPGGGITLSFPSGVAFATGIGITITGGIAAADTTAIGASEVAVSLTYH